MICYGQVNSGRFCQEWYESASRDARRRARQLRAAGYDVTVAPMGPQMTGVGVIRMTLVDVRPGANADTAGLPAEDWRLSVYAHRAPGGAR
jgi:hypothetical protein